MLSQKLQHYKDNYLTREVKVIEDGLMNFSSNNYLGLAGDEQVKQAFIQGAKIYGFGSSSSPLISGYYDSTEQLEKRFSEILNVEECIFFNSGYHANLGIIQALQKTVVMDKLCHASIIDGASILDKKFYRYNHNDLNHASKILAQHSDTLLISERIFSMEGDIANIVELEDLSKQYDSLLIIDDAHGFGILPNDIKADLIVIPLGKALGGMGAIVAGNKLIISYLRQFTRSYIYSTALPPAIAYANLAALEILEKEEWRRTNLIKLIILFNSLAKQYGIKLASEDITPIRSILIGDNKLAKEIEKKLYNKGFFVKAIVKPTVQIARIRISLSIIHQAKDIIDLIEAINEY